MLCDNCKKRQANIRYSENINGITKELNLCEECSKKLGIGDISFDLSMPIDFSNFFGDFIENFTTPEFMPLFNEVKQLKCNNCGYTFNDVVNTGKLGCGECYSVFESQLDPIIKKIQGSNMHVGRIGKVLDNKISDDTATSNEKKEQLSEIDKLNLELKQAIKEERYEDAAKLRDEIKEIENATKINNKTEEKEDVAKSKDEKKGEENNQDAKNNR